MSFHKSGTGYIPTQSNISFVFADSSNSATVPLSGTGATADDLLVGASLSSDQSTAITLPGGYSQPSVGGYVEQVIYDGAALGVPFAVYGLAAYKFATGGSPTWTGFTSAQTSLVGIYRGTNQTTPVIGVTFRSGGSNNVTYGSLSHNSPTAWVLAFLRTSGDITAPPVLLTQRDVGTRRGLWDSNGPMRNYAGETVTASGTVTRWCTCVMAIQSSFT